MKDLKRYMSFVAIFALLFTSCSKDQEDGINNNSDTATLSFGAIVNDLVNNRAANKQAVSDLPECTDDTPSYVEIVLMQGDTEIVGSTGNAYRVNLVAGQVFTEEDANLELPAGNYTLEHFAVFNSSGDIIWVAPRTGSALGDFVDNALPLNIDLNAGVKKYVDVSVICFDDRDVNEYGYLFFELDTNIALTYCFFANYCNDAGMHYPAQYSISIWSGTSSNGVLIYEDEWNSVGQYDDTDEFYATPLCLALPDNDDMDTPYLYYEVTLQDWAENYGSVSSTVIEGTLTKRMIVDNFSGSEATEYHHLRFGCEGDDPGNGGTPPDSDGDGIPDSEDECPNTPGVEEYNGCPEPDECDVEDPNADCDNDGVLNGVDECPLVAGTAENNGCPGNGGGETCLPAAEEGCETFEDTVSVSSSSTVAQLEFGDLTAEVNGSGLFIGLTPIAPYEFSDIEVTVGDIVLCVEDIVPNEGGSITIEGITAADLPINVGIRVNACNILE